MQRSDDIRSGAYTWVKNCVPFFSGSVDSITTPAGSTLNYWDFGIVEVNTAASEKKDQNAVVNIWGYHDVDYYNAGKPPIERWNQYPCNMVSGTDYYQYEMLTGV